MKAYFALLSILLNIPLFGMDIKDTKIKHITRPFNTIELCTKPCDCLSRLGFIDNFEHTSSSVKLDATTIYTFDMEGFDKLTLPSLEYIFKSGITHHSGKKHLWNFHKQFLIPLVLAIKNKEKQTTMSTISETTRQQFSILLRDLLIAQENNPELLSILFKAVNPDLQVPIPEITGNLSTKPIFFFAKTVQLLDYCVKNHATLTRTDAEENTILHEIVNDTSLPIEQKKAMLSFCLERGVNDDHNRVGKTACDICYMAAQKNNADQKKWYSLVDLLLRVKPSEKNEPENPEQISSPPSANEPIPTSKPTQRSSWWPWSYNS